MSAAVFVVVVFAAFLHAIWNALMKESPDKHVGILGVSVGRAPMPSCFSRSHRYPMRQGCLGFWEAWSFTQGTNCSSSGLTESGI